MVNKRFNPDYYNIIKEPIAMSTVKASINFKNYKHFSHFVSDFARITHNAQLYNLPGSVAYQNALIIRVCLRPRIIRMNCMR